MAIHLRRREFIATLGSAAAAWPLAARAQQAQKAPLVVALMPFDKGDEEAERRQSAFQNGLEQFGCGAKRVDVRPNWKEQPPAESLTGKQWR
jgi:putative tryptophan/tyrosine transport system substrate-binding protein